MTPTKLSALDKLSDSDLIQLIHSDSSSSEAAKVLLLRRYRNLLLSSLRPYLVYFHDFKELFTAATLGFLLSVEKFDLQKGSSIGQYARPYIINLLCECVKYKVNSEKNIIVKPIEDVFTEQPASLQEDDNIDLDKEADALLLKSAIEDFRIKLTERENELIELIFYEGMNLSEAAKNMKISRQRTSQLLLNIKEKGKIELKNYKNLI